VVVRAQPPLQAQLPGGLVKMSISRVAPVTVLLGGCNRCGESLSPDGGGEPEWQPAGNGQPGERSADALSVVYLDRGRIELVRVPRPASWSAFARLSSSRLVCVPAPVGCRLAE